MEFAGKHLSTHNEVPRAKAAVVDIITSEKAPREKPAGSGITGARVPEFRAPFV